MAARHSGMSTSRGGFPSPVTPRGRIPVHWCTPECVCDSDCQRPLIHRLLRRRTVRSESLGLRASSSPGRRLNGHTALDDDGRLPGPGVAKLSRCHWPCAGRSALLTTTNGSRVDEHSPLATPRAQRRPAAPSVTLRQPGLNHRWETTFDAIPPGLETSGSRNTFGRVTIRNSRSGRCPPRYQEQTQSYSEAQSNSCRIPI